MNILVTGVGSTLGYGILDTIKKLSIECKICGTDYLKTAVGLYQTDYAHILPDIYKHKELESEWLDALVRIISEREIKYVLIGLDFEVPLFAKHKEFIENKTGCKVIVSSEEVVKICNDKWLTNVFLRDAGFDIPKSCLPENLESFRKTNPFPWIIKPRQGSTSFNLFKVSNEDTLNNALENCNDPIIQEEVGNIEEEFTCGVLFVDNKILSSIALRRKLKNGNTSVAYSSKFDEIENYIRKVAKKLSPYGPINIQLRLTDKGPMVFEINPRFSGTTSVRASFGLNEISILIEYLENGTLTEDFSIKEGMVIRYTVNQFVPSQDMNKFVKV